MRLLFYTMNWYPFEGSIQPIFAEVLRSLQQAGHEVTILTSIPYPVPGRSERWDEYRGKFFLRESWQGAEVIRTWVCSPSILHSCKIMIRLLNMVSFCLHSLLVGLFLRRRFDILMTVSHPPIAIGLNSGFIALAKRCPFVYCLEDIYPDILAEAGLIRRRLLFRFLRGLERWVYRRADRICVLSESMKSNLVDKKTPAEKIEVIPHFADTDRIKPLPRDNDLARSLNLTDTFVILYPGSLSFRYGIEEILAAVERIGDNPNVRWIFIDRGQHRQEYRREIEDRKLNRARILPFQTEQDYPWLLASCDVGLVTLERGFGAYSVPSKLFGLMAAGRAVLAMSESTGEVARIVRQAKCGLVVEPGDFDSLAKAVRRLAEDREQCRRMGLRGRDFLVANFPRDLLCQRYRDLLQSCRKNPPES